MTRRLSLLCALAFVVVVASKHHSEKAMHRAGKSGHKAFRHGGKIFSSPASLPTTAAGGKITVKTKDGKKVEIPQEKAEYLKTLIAQIPYDAVDDDTEAIDWIKSSQWKPIPSPTCTAAHLGIVTGIIDLHLEQKKQLAKIANDEELENNEELKNRVDEVLGQIEAIPTGQVDVFMQCLEWLYLDPTLFDMKDVPLGDEELLSMRPIVDRLLRVIGSQLEAQPSSLRELSSYIVALHEFYVPTGTQQEEWDRESVRHEAFVAKYFKTPAGDWLQRDQMISPAVGEYLPENFKLQSLYRALGGVTAAVNEGHARSQDVGNIVRTLTNTGHLKVSRDGKVLVLVKLPG